MRLPWKVLAAASLLVLTGLAAFVIAYRVPDQPVEALKAKWAPQPSKFIAVAGMSVHVRDEGPRDDPAPIVLLHGTSASLHTWDAWTAALARSRRVVRFDLPAFGLTGPAPDANYTIESYARVTVAVLDQLGVQRAVLVGNSLGGYVAWATALLHPARVTGLVLIDSAGYAFRSESVPIAFRIATTPGLNRLMEGVLPRSVVESSLKNVYGDAAKVTPELVDRYFELTTRAGNRAALVQRFEQTQPTALADRVPELRIPTLILWGRHDRLIPLEQGQRFHREIQGSELVVFETLGHVPHEEDPAATSAAFMRFLAKNQPALGPSP